MSNFIEELKWRGMIHDIMPGLEEELQKGTTAGYIGFDPTADSLHIGSLVQIMTLVHFQNAGHKPYALVGGATGMVGDPSGKTKERQLLSIDDIQHNLDCMKSQLENFLDFNSDDNSAEVVNNHDWFKDFSFLEFIREVGKNISVNYMMAKESVKNRLETGMSFTEFSYQLIQGYDFYHLYKNNGCKIQLGGSDQWGNITTGTELIRRMEGGEAWAVTTPLLKKADGTKFGKSEGGNIWLDPKKTSPYKFVQYWINSADEDVKSYIKIFTLKSKEEIDQLIAQHDENPGARVLQYALAEDITTRVHSKEEYDNAIKAAQILFSKDATEEIKSIDEDTIRSVFEGVPHIQVGKDELFGAENLIQILGALTNNEIFKSNGEVKRSLKEGSVRLNKAKVQDGESKPEINLLQDKFLLVQKGKKNYFLVEAV